MTAATKLPLNGKVEKVFRRVLAAVGVPWNRARRGRTPKRSPKDYALALFARSFYGFSYRTAEAVLKIPKSCLHWAFKRLANPWINALIANTAARLRRQTPPTCAVMDSTGVSLSGNGFTRRTQYREYWKLHAFVEYAPAAHAVWIACAQATRGNVADITIGKQFLSADLPPTLLLADKAYDSNDFFREAFHRGWRVCMRQRKTGEWNRGLRGRVWRTYDDEKYRGLRGRIESVFGGFAKRYSSRINERLESTRESACLLWAAAHNIRTLTRVLTKLIYWTVSCLGKF